MGKYMRKSKTSSEVALPDLSHAQSSLGVRTRAKTLALQRLQRSTAVAPSASSAGCSDCGSYMQLRNRRLQKSPIGSHPKSSPRPQRSCPRPNLTRNHDLRASPPLRKSSSGNSSSVNKDGEEKGENFLPESKGSDEGADKGDNLDFEASFGENLEDFEGRERTTRESTPCSFIRDPNAIQTPPGSSTSRRLTSLGQVHSSRPQNSSQSPIPATREVDEFFSDAEVQQQRQFIEKYNYDPVNDKPLPGRYEWKEVNL
ncbi:unnamed protein product [Cuscuta campestris]|uniref:Cyclin-dependent kinase inhibitor domain-containing protein n=1 Tax=Cuscuta campestris TaxID=132261 RepID=A0A484MB06_9ASTE|nr:unnamed protein product [Cuscuta campestris]